MASSLQSKLNRLKSAEPARPAPPPPQLMEHIARFPADETLFSLSPRALKRLGFPHSFDPSRALFLDTETTGLSGGAGTVAFLVGLGRIEGKELVVRQFLMPNYASEPQLLLRVNEFAGGCDTVVTFNGKSFDVPLLQSRHIMCRMDCPIASMKHLDLIHPARRVWKLRLKDCSLSNLEEKILFQHREHDLPGCEVPESQGNFLFVDVGMDADELYEKLLRKGFLVFPCAAWGYPHHIRLSFAMPEQNRRFIATLKEVLGR